MISDIEQKAIDAMLHRGVKISIPERSFLKYFGKKKRTFTIHQSYLCTLFHISTIAIQLKYSEKQLSESPFEESKQLVAKYAKSMPRIIAIAILGSDFKIRLFSGYLSGYLFRNLTPEKLAQLSLIVMQMNNVSDFINSIRLMSGARISAPKSLSPADNGG